MPALTLTAPAKLNLTLEVLGRRPDGFHALRSVVQAVTLADRVTFAPAGDLRLHCSRADLEGPDNLVWRAAELLRRSAGVSRGARIELEKRVPVAAGLGGGSSDAAAALQGLDTLWGLGLPRAALLDLGAQLGSDVPFFLGEGPAALVEGRGERLTSLPDLPARWVVLCTPPLPVSTGAVFRAFPPARWSNGRRTTAWLAGWQQGQPGEPSLPEPFNDLEAVTLALFPDAGAGCDALRAAGARHPVLTGSGPTAFALFAGEAEARAVYARLVAGPQSPPGSDAFLARFGPLARPAP